MSLTSVAKAVADWFAPGQVAYLSTIYPHPPKLVPEQEWFQAAVQFPSQADSGAVIYIHVDDRKQKRISVGGQHSGRKYVTNQITLLCYFRSAAERSELAGAENYEFLDALEARLLADRNLGTATGPDIPAGAIFQAGEGGENGGDDIDIKPGIPVTIGGQITQVFSTFAFEADEILDA